MQKQRSEEEREEKGEEERGAETDAVKNKEVQMTLNLVEKKIDGKS